MIKPPGEGDYVRRYGHLVLLVPGAGQQLLGGNVLEDWKILQGELAR